MGGEQKQPQLKLKPRPLQTLQHRFAGSSSHLQLASPLLLLSEQRAQAVADMAAGMPAA